MAAFNLDGADLRDVLVGGLIHEETMNKLWQIDFFPLPLTERIGSGPIGNARFSWTKEEYTAPIIDGQKIDGEDTIADDDTKLGDRVNSFAEIDTKTVKVSTRASASNTIAFANSLAHQVSQRQVELRRDVEAVSLSNNPSLEDDGTAVAGQTAGLDAWLETNTSEGALGSPGGFNTGTGIVDAYTLGTPRALNESIFKDLLQAVFEQGGESMVVMAVPQVIRLFSEFQFTLGARVATLARETAGDKTGPTSSIGAVNVYIGDFATVELVANRLQPQTAADVSTMFLLDMKLIEHAILAGYRTEPLQKSGLADNRQIQVDWGLRVGNEAGLAAFRDIDETTPMVAGP